MEIWVREVGVEGFWLGKSGFVGLLPSSLLIYLSSSSLLLISLPFFLFVVDLSSLFL